MVAMASCITSIFFWVGAAVIGLVTLRKGASEGAIVLLWAILPALAVLYYLGEVLPVSTLLGVFALAAVLRTTVSLNLVVFLAPLTGLVLGGVLVTIASDYLEFLVQVIASVVDNFESELAQGQQNAVQIVRPTGELISGGLVMMHTIVVVISVILARWWQSVLYNPGGFRDEFHKLRLEYRQASALLIAAGYLYSRDENLALWSVAFLVPLIVSGLGLLHCLVDRLHNGTRWLVLIYVSLILISPVKYVLCLFAVIDSFIDVRSRARKSE
jgi:hypothetical protein